MATFDIRGYGTYQDNAGNASFSGSTTIDSSITDGEGDGTFEVGDAIWIGAAVGPADGVFRGTINIGGTVCVVIQSIRDPDDLFVFSPVPAGSFGGWPGGFSAGSINPSTFAVCFAAGTMIATPDGERAVEALAIGDMVLTADGKSVPVKWVGRQTVHKIFTPRERFVPVRVKAGALGGGLPKRDLVLTADHALVIDGMLVNAGAIVNGSTIAWEPFDALPECVTYYHVETEAHDIILAEDAPAETFVDHVTRRRFDNFAEYETLHGDEATITSLDMPRVSAARLVPKPLRERLGERAVA